MLSIVKLKSVHEGVEEMAHLHIIGVDVDWWICDRKQYESFERNWK